MKWEKAKLGDVLDKIIGGGTPSKNNLEYWNGNINWASVKDFQDGYYRLNSTEDKISELGLKNSSSNLIPIDTIVTPTRMGLGRVCISKIETAINQDLKALIPNRERIDNAYLLYTLINKRQEIEAMGRGATVKGITLDMLKSLEINLPSLETQKKIANLLSKYDDLIENNLKRIELLEEAAQRLYKEWFIDLRFPGYEKVKIENGIPKGWEKTILKKMCVISSGKRPRIKVTNKTKEAQFPIIGASGVMAYTSDYLLSENILTIGRVGTLGIVQRYEEPIWPSDNTLLFMGETKNYIEQFLKKVSYQNLNRGSSQPLITQGDMGNLEILSPQAKILMKFENISENFYSMKKNLQIQNQKLTEARDRLLPKLMKGEIEI